MAGIINHPQPLLSKEGGEGSERSFGGSFYRQLITPSEVSKAVRAAITIWMIALMMSFFIA